jgi:phage repressor protein C with HTH and peptisase S24 domain
MSSFSETTVNQRFKAVFQYLEKNGLIKGKSDIAKQLGTYNHVINSVLKGERNITVEQINLLVKAYGVNANYMFGRSARMLDTPEEEIMPSEGVFEGRQNITLVPQKAMAGYAVGIGNQAYVDSLPRFSVPGMEGQLVAFEISGDSMQPTITSGDIVICEQVERNEPLRENQIYIIVTDTVVAKRILQIKTNNKTSHLQLISDNPIYRPYQIGIEDVQQILRVKNRLTNYGIG